MWVLYVCSGFILFKMIVEGVVNNFNVEFVLMEKYGLVIWGEMFEVCYEKMIFII